MRNGTVTVRRRSVRQQERKKERKKGRQKERESALTVVEERKTPGERWSLMIRGQSLREEDRCSTDSSAVPLWFTLRLPLRPPPTQARRARGRRRVNEKGLWTRERERWREEVSGERGILARNTMTFVQAGSYGIPAPDGVLGGRSFGTVMKIPGVSSWKVIYRHDGSLSDDRLGHAW